MKLKELLFQNQQHPNTIRLADWTALSNQKRVHLKGILCSAPALTAATLYNLQPRTSIFIFNDREEAHYFQTDLENLLDGKKVNFFGSGYKREPQPGAAENARVQQRAEVLGELSLRDHRTHLIVTYADAVAEKVPGHNNLIQNTIPLRQNENYDMDRLIEQLHDMAFDRTDFVYEPGQYAVRGGIIDVFSYGHNFPYRIEFFGNEVESLREFDPTTQLSTKTVQWLNIVPNLQLIEKDQFHTLFDYLPQDATIWVKDYKDVFENLDEKNRIRHNKFKEQDFLNSFLSAEALKNKADAFNIVEFGTRFHYRTANSLEYRIQPQPMFHKNFQLLINNLKQNTGAGLMNLIFSDTSKQVERLHTIFEDIDKTIKFEPVYHSISQGFIDNDLKLACYTEHQIFDRFYNYKARQSFSKSKALTLKELRDLKPGDFVTHIDHGIGKFAGLQKIDVHGHMQEAVKIIYKDNDTLFVSINSLHKIAKYVGKEGTEPKMHKLGSDAWEKLKQKTKRKVKDIARDLIKLYAKRKAAPGFAYSPDTYLQLEMEASFMYEDTPDQSRATEDVKKDMETAHPMDRLVCGDVGFGKTEVAMRAAFKAVADSKQVAVLVPTTILAQQHYKNFKERFSGFPCNVDYINRFKSAKEQKDTLKKVEEGKVDILIGTHRIISKDVQFKELGLLIIDEEQKFGVAAKERLKELRVNIDTLTLTATPIPRTLHFSLMGARDLSIINTPPPNRQAVNTELHNFSTEIVKQAIDFEVSRGGQVFFVHHRVRDIQEIADMIRKICPDVNVGVAHGQMEGDKLEDNMIKFVDGEYDVLVATTIIESGLDISNANTIIINNAHHFGLSDLHQMRGRVGRNNKKAYCYLLVPGIHSLTDDAKKRLSAIEEFSDLGSGFNVAMRDLDIRGAGNLLGGEQSGFIAEIGFEMYHKILDEAIQELKHDEFSEVFKEELQTPLESYDCGVETDLEMLIPDSYVRNNTERLSLYASLSSLNDAEDLKNFRNHLKDRFGTLPKQVEILCESLRLKWIGKELGLEKISLRNHNMYCYFPSNKNSAYFQSESFNHFLQYVQRNGNRCQMKQTAKNLALMVKNVYTLEDAIRELFVVQSA